VPPPAVEGQIRAAALSIPVGLLLLVGGCAAVALGERALGGTLVALAVISPVIGCVLLYRAKNAVLAAIRAEQELRSAEVDRIIGFRPNPPDLS
jgi:ABC-type uncharacterized transport system permease subunit